MKLEDVGIARDEREGTTLRASATTGRDRTIEAATTAALTSLFRVAELRFAEIDATTVAVRTKAMRTPGGAVVMVVATATAYTKPYGITEVFEA
jgi:hypothetical protein